MQTPNREIFLHPPEPQRESNSTKRNRKAIKNAASLMAQAFPSTMTQKRHNTLLVIEATSSAAIESEYREIHINNHRLALTQYLKEPIDPQSLLTLHKKMMKNQPLAQPGRYRSVEVSVGRHHPPTTGLVPSLMNELLTYMQEEGHDPLFQAAWVHIEFETVHPFADGNGRTGRALINRILGSPIPISQYILRNQQEYYRLLDSGEWDEYLDWFIRGITQQSNNFMASLADDQ